MNASGRLETLSSGCNCRYHSLEIFLWDWTESEIYDFQSNENDVGWRLSKDWRWLQGALMFSSFVVLLHLFRKFYYVATSTDIAKETLPSSLLLVMCTNERGQFQFHFRFNITKFQWTQIDNRAEFHFILKFNLTSLEISLLLTIFSWTILCVSVAH